MGVVRGTYAAGGSDSSCYALMADAYASGALQPTSDLIARVPWPDAAKTFTPGGFVASETHPSASAPVCAPGFSLLLAPLITVGGFDAIFLLTPIAGALLVWLTFVAGRSMAGPLAGAMAAVLIAASPAMLYQVVQPMTDVTTAALWMATVVSLLRRRYLLAGGCCGLALLVRPNLLPLAVVAGFATLPGIRDWGTGIRNVTRFAVAALPFGLLVLWLNNGLYGSPFRTGYGQLDNLFGLAVVPLNTSRYLGWLTETHTLFPLLAFAAPFVAAPEKRADAGLAIGLILATCAIYVFYTPFDHWSYLRFLLPAIALMMVLASGVIVHALTRIFPQRSGVAALTVSAITVGLAIFYVRTADDRLAFNLKFLEQRYRSAGLVVRDRLPENAVVLSVWDSGAVRFHGRKEALTWAGLEPAWLDRALAWLDENGRTPYILVESWEEPAFRLRFGKDSDVGKLDWPPKYEIDRVVRIFDPKDRAKYDRGETVNTEYLWPMRRR
ncbi:MAG TPA: hypothetical protein VM115_04660 [Vicinamibacterales bacterium]|nr:hypothetical protein [Vicinamibacterales bacterium]